MYSIVNSVTANNSVKDKLFFFFFFDLLSLIVTWPYFEGQYQWKKKEHACDPIITKKIVVFVVKKKKTTVPVINIQSKWRKDGENIKREILLLITMITNNTEQNFHIAQNLTLRVKRVIKCKLKKSKSYPKLRN